MSSHAPNSATAGQGDALATNLVQDQDHCHPKHSPAQASVCRRPVLSPSTAHPRRLSPRIDGQLDRKQKCAALQLPASDPADRIRWRHSLDIGDHPSRWFEDSNRNVSGNHNGLFIDEDLPFYIPEPSCFEDDSACAVPSESSHNQQSLSRHGRCPKRSALSRTDSGGSKSDDFRSVIDDLTVENKRLRRRLRKYEGLHCSHLQRDKLFEVRCHGLSARKKRELEETLRRFASSLEQSPGEPKPTSPSGSLTKAPHKQPCHVDSLSSPSYSRLADSAYASMFPSGVTNVDKLQDEPQRVRMKNHNERDLDTLVYAVPDGSFGADQLRRSEKIRKKLVVRKLEQLFTGKEAASKTRSSQPQQHKSLFARKPDGSVKERSGHRLPLEGVREARILPADAESLADGTSVGRLPATLQSTFHTGCSSARSRKGEINASSDSSPEQRPTRPLDIDPNRAQIPAENIEYIRHLGFSSSSVDANAMGADREGWVYLNLLISMAQLHTINVTPDFVRKAVAEVSDRFELSRDGRKIRWKGGTEGTRMSSDVGSSEDLSNEKSPDNLVGRSGKGRRIGNKLLHGDVRGPEHKVVSSSVGLLQQPNVRSTDDGHKTKTRRIFLEQAHARKGLEYKPLFRHATCSESDECSFQTSNSVASLGMTGDSIGVTSAAHTPVSQKWVPDHLEPIKTLARGPWRHGTKNQPANGHGPIIFYHGASFCTDLSGDMRYLSEEATEFGQRAQDPLGSDKITSKSSILDADNVRSSPRKLEASPDHLDYSSDRSGSGMAGIQFPTVRSTGSDAACEGAAPLEFAASGIGGVQPDDNFAINVRVRQVTAALEQSDSMALTSSEEHRQLLFNTPYRGTSSKKQSRAVVRGEIVSAVMTKLPPSSLPPPSYCLSLSTSGTDDDDETESVSTDRSANDVRSSQMDAGPSAASSSIQGSRIVHSGRPVDKCDLESEYSNLDADDDAW